MLKLAITTIGLIILTSTTYAHNEDKPGPHGGHIQMPANFHTEVISAKNAFHVYLLDMQFENPTTKNSWVKAFVINAKKKTLLKCSPMGEEHFQCVSKKPIKTGFLILKTKRNGTEASMDAKYEIPLKPFDSQPSMAPAPTEDHSSHH